jgi:conjugative transfer pilus assembly protein TraH
MKTMAPQIENLFSQIRKMAQDVNAMMMNDCLASQQIVGGLLPRTQAVSEHICKDIQGQDKDWFNARRHCEKDSSLQANLNSAKELSKDLLVGDYNLVWHILKKMEAYKNDQAFAEFIMTTVGTLISRKEGERFRTLPVQGKADQKGYLAAYLKGGEVDVLKCDEPDKCLHPRLQKMAITDDATMSAKVLGRIQDLRQRYIEGTPITAHDIAFLNDAVNLPVYRYIQVSAAVGSPFIMQDTAEYLAISLLIHQFERLATEILEALETLQKIQLEESAIASFKKRVQETRARLQALLTQANINAAWRLEQMIKSYEQAIIAKNS